MPVIKVLASSLLFCCWPILAAGVSYEAVVTQYCHCARCCGKANQPTASGAYPKAGLTVAGPRKLPFGTKVQIEGLGTYIVQDRTARRHDGVFDVFVGSDKGAHQRAIKFGRQKLKVTILK
jgi:3D (Asp-Asp-Asp) domain-containing protein